MGKHMSFLQAVGIMHLILMFHSFIESNTIGSAPKDVQGSQVSSLQLRQEDYPKLELSLCSLIVSSKPIIATWLDPILKKKKKKPPTTKQQQQQKNHQIISDNKAIR
jgi:hypothetical protein